MLCRVAFSLLCIYIGASSLWNRAFALLFALSLTPLSSLLNLVKSNGDNAMGDVREVDEVEAIVRALVDGDKGVSARGKSKAEVLL